MNLTPTEIEVLRQLAERSEHWQRFDQAPVEQRRSVVYLIGMGLLEEHHQHSIYYYRLNVRNLVDCLVS